MFLDDAPVLNGSSSNSSAIIGGAVGGFILLLMITLVLCVVIPCLRCHRKATFPLVSKVSTNVTAIVEADTKANTGDRLYNTIKPRNQDVPITPNPSYGAPTQPFSTTIEDKSNLMSVMSTWI